MAAVKAAVNESPAPTVSATGTLGVSWKETHSRSEHIAAVRSASQDKHLQVIFSQQNPAFVLQVDARVAENTADGHQLLIVYLEDVAAAHGFAEYLFGIEPLAEIDVEYLQLPLASGIVSRKRLMVMRLVSLRCAKEPKHTARVFSARRFSSSVKGMLSQATPSFIS